MKIFFLSASQPLTKSYSLSARGELQKTNYPNVMNFTSHAVIVDDIQTFHRALSVHARQGMCMLKGTPSKTLLDESRAGSTDSNGTTQYICLDFDKAPFASVEDALSSLWLIGDANKASPFADVSYVVQYSASHGLPGVVGLNCHVFMLLSHEFHAPYLKAWLMMLNLNTESLSAGLKLNATGTHLNWPLDITTCQNDKLLFIAPPVLHGVKSTLPDIERIQLVVKDNKTLPIARIQRIDISATKLLALRRKNQLREVALLPVRKAEPKQVDDHYVIAAVDEATITGMRESENFVHMNLNGGDSWSYWHPKDNFEFIHCFKHPDEWLSTKKLLPEYYGNLMLKGKQAQAAPLPAGDIILTIRDLKSSSYWNGTWNPATQTLEIYMANNVKMLDDFRMQHNRTPLDYIPTWDIKFDPHSNSVVDETARVINTYIPTELMRSVPSTLGSLSKCPKTLHTIMWALNCGPDDEMLEHFLNWLAVIYQKKIKTQTVWVMSGNEGTGKGVIVNEVLAPTLGRDYVAHHDGAVLEEQYNGWMENKLLVSFNEVDITSSALSKKIEQKLKHLITEKTMTMRHMYRGSFEATSFCNFIMATNESEPIRISGGDRRYNIGNFQPSKLVYDKSDIDAIRAENAAWVHYIMTRKADADYARKIIESDARARLIDVSRTSLEDTATAVLDGHLYQLFDIVPDMDVLVETRGMNTGYASHFESVVRREMILLRNMGATRAKAILTAGEQKKLDSLGVKRDDIVVVSKLSREELFTVFEYAVGNMPDTPAKFTKLLKHKGISVSPTRICEKIVRGLQIVWHVTPLQLEEMSQWLSPPPQLVSSTVTPKSSPKPRAKLAVSK